MIFHKENKKLQHKGETDLTKEEFLTWTKNVWYFPAETRRIHPTSFPEELPHRLIKMFTWIGDTVLDPFCGSGTTGLAAYKLNRSSIGIDVSPKYIRMSKDRLDNFIRERDRAKEGE